MRLRPVCEGGLFVLLPANKANHLRKALIPLAQAFVRASDEAACTVTAVFRAEQDVQLIKHS